MLLRRLILFRFSSASIITSSSCFNKYLTFIYRAIASKFPGNRSRWPDDVILETLVERLPEGREQKNGFDHDDWTASLRQKHLCAQPLWGNTSVCEQRLA